MKTGASETRPLTVLDTAHFALCSVANLGGVK